MTQASPSAALRAIGSRGPSMRECGVPDFGSSSGDAASRRRESARQADLRRNDHVPRGLRIAAAWSWRLIVLGALIYLATRVISEVSEVIIPVVIALLLTAVLKPIVDVLDRHHVPRALAVAVALFIAILAISALVLLVIWQIQTNFDDLSNGISQGIDKIKNWLDDTFNISSTQLNSSLDQVQNWISDNRERITEGAVSTAATLTHIVTGLLIVLFSTIFFLKDGRAIWLWLVRVLVPRDYEDVADEAGLRAWHTLGGYVRATVAVAALDAIFIGLGVYFTGVPLAIPIGVLVFLFSFVPLFGATISGLIAVLIALVFNGPISAVIVLAVVLGVQQIEGHVLQPVLMSRAVKVHPLAVVIGITTGVTVAGIIGALVAVPLIAMANTVGTFLAHQNPHEEAAAQVEQEGGESGKPDPDATAEISKDADADPSPVPDPADPDADADADADPDADAADGGAPGGGAAGAEDAGSGPSRG
jgi:predicted PurR-regulated permease PerM